MKDSIEFSVIRLKSEQPTLAILLGYLLLHLYDSSGDYYGSEGADQDSREVEFVEYQTKRTACCGGKDGETHPGA